MQENTFWDYEFDREKGQIKKIAHIGMKINRVSSASLQMRGGGGGDSIKII